MIMSYRDELKRKILELEKQIASDRDKKWELESELNKLQIAEFEEEMRESDNQHLLKG
jgi:hypothetical protein